jgi:hypothetical protein
LLQGRGGEGWLNPLLVAGRSVIHDEEYDLSVV